LSAQKKYYATALLNSNIIDKQKIGDLGAYTIPRLKCTSSLRAQQSNPEKIIFHFNRRIV